MLLALAASLALSAPLDDLDIRHAQEQVYHRHRISSYRGSHREEEELVRDWCAASKEIGGDYARELLLLSGAIFSVESEWSFIWHDSGIGWGPGALQREEVFASARRLGVAVETKVQKDACWQRFVRDRTFCVWVSVRHVRRLVESYDGVVMAGVRRHNPHAKHYVGDVLERYGILWSEMPDMVWHLK